MNKTFIYSILQSFGTYNNISTEYYQYMDKEAVRKRASALERWAIERINHNIDVEIINDVIADIDLELCGSECNITIEFFDYLCNKDANGYNDGKQYARKVTVKNYKGEKVIKTDTYSFTDNYGNNPGAISAQVYTALPETKLIERVTLILNNIVNKYACGTGKTVADFNIDVSAAVKVAERSDCPYIETYTIDYSSYNCLLDYQAEGANTLPYQNRKGLSIARYITVNIEKNGVADDSRKIEIDLESYKPAEVSTINYLNGEQIETLKNTVKAFIDSKINAPDLLPVINPVVSNNSVCPPVNATANIARWNNHQCSTHACSLDKYALGIGIRYVSMLDPIVKDYDIVQIYNSAHPNATLTQATLLAKTSAEYLAVVQEVYTILQTYHTNSNLFEFAAFNPANFIIANSNDCKHALHFGYIYECMLDYNGINAIPNGKKIAVRIEITDQTAVQSHGINVRNGLSQLNQNEFPFTGLPSGYSAGDEILFLNNAQIYTLMGTAYAAMENRLCPHEVADSEIEQYFVITDNNNECEHEYNLLYEYSCMLTYANSYVNKNGTKIAISIEVEDVTANISYPITVADYCSQLNQNEFPFTGLPSGYNAGDEILFLNSTQINTLIGIISNVIIGMIGNEAFNNQNFNNNFIMEDSDCEPQIIIDPNYYCHEVVRWIYDDTRLITSYQIIRTSVAFPGSGGFVKKKLSGVQGNPYSTDSYGTEPATTKGNWKYSDAWTNPAVQINGKDHTGRADYPQYFPVSSITTLDQRLGTKGIVTMNLCITTSKNYAICCNVDDYFNIYMDDVRVAYKDYSESAGQHVPMYVFEIYIAKGNHILKFEFADKGMTFFGAALEIFDDINVLFAQYDTRADKVAAFTQHRILSTLDYMYDVYENETETIGSSVYTFDTRAYGLVPYYSLSAADIADGWEIVPDVNCDTIAARKQILGYSGFRIAKHVLINNEGVYTAVINSSIYPGKTVGDTITVEETVYTITHVFDVPADLVENKEYYKNNPIIVNGTSVLYYDTNHEYCPDNAYIREFSWEDYPSKQTIEIEVEASITTTARPDISSFLTDTEGNVTETSFTISYPTSNAFVSSNGTLTLSANTTSNPRKNIIEYTQSESGLKLYLSVIQWGTTSGTVYDFTTSLPVKNIACFQTKTVIQVLSTLNGRYHPVIVDAPGKYVNFYEVHRLQGSFDTAEIILHLKQNLTTALITFDVDLIQSNSGKTVTQTINVYDCKNSSFKMEVSLISAYHFLPQGEDPETPYFDNIYLVVDTNYTMCKRKAVLKLNIIELEGTISTNSTPKIEFYSVFSQPHMFLYEIEDGQDGFKYLYIWPAANNTSGETITNGLIIGSPEVKRYYVNLLPDGDTRYDDVTECD